MYNILGNSKFCLIGKIKGLANESKRTRSHLDTAKSEKIVYKLAIRKRVVGSDIRHHLLAYALLRGILYAKLEQNCREDNKPNANCILKIVHAHLSEYDCKKWDIEKVNNWLSGVVS